MIISIVNDSTIKSDDEVQEAIRAVNRQIAEDVTPYWGLSATLRLDGTGKGGTIARVRGDGLLRLRDEVGAFHAVTEGGIPSGIVFTQMAEALHESHPFLSWTSALSHEAIEMLIDPNVNSLVRGPHPTSRRHVFYYKEVCDPVQSQVYMVDGIPVSNFVLPDYYIPGPKSSNTNFLGIPLKPFGWVKHGSVGFFDPMKGAHGAYVVWPPWGPADVRKKAALYKKKMNASRLLRYAKPISGGRSR